ncbi:hypothetical protein ACYB6N_25835 [Klebsiella pneumoniae]|jgi:hypothetical protein|uniref:hypothetical protein n=1 Tax=Enterobacterales TaxID=91347 RepID=UPI0011550A68|nr:hypothetical protein [Klebsiella pneumoniae]MDR7342136.1 hypothetical protein [Pantoea alhagi]HCQ8226509.1 hypothetical protein [Klebsiella variicola]MCB3011216.1 hypothetical protein [Klebsiella pneumoniae]MCB3212094.1 hypothetical protein [Klebsiella pneumoniae]MCB3223820.1 hypothetical protein [Klebsiella pneumoniae]
MANKKSVYVPAPTIGSLFDVERELRRIQEGFTSVGEHIATEKTFDAPTKDVELQIRYADGVTWNPRGLGAGLYIFVDGVWRKFTLT